MLVWTLNCLTGACKTEGAWRPTWAFIRSHGQPMPLPPGGGAMAPVSRRKPASQVPEERWLLSRCQKFSYTPVLAHFSIFGTV